LTRSCFSAIPFLNPNMFSFAALNVNFSMCAFYPVKYLSVFNYKAIIFFCATKECFRFFYIDIVQKKRYMKLKYADGISFVCRC